MTTTPSKTITTKTVNNKTGITKSVSTTTSGKSTTVTKTTTIGKAASVSSPSSSVSAPAKLASSVLGSAWLAGPNDTRPQCAPVAVANALLGSLGIESSNAAIERLYASAGGTGDSGVPLVPVLQAARSSGLTGCRLKVYRRAALDDADVVLLEFAAIEGLHAAAFAGMHVITWGAEIPLADLDARIIDAWSLTWHGQETASA